MSDLEKRIEALEFKMTALAAVFASGSVATVTELTPQQKQEVIEDVPFDPTGTVSVSTEPTNEGKLELDANNCPWDERINTSNFTKKTDGVWKRKPRITDEFYNEVVAEIKVCPEPKEGDVLINVPGIPATPTVPSVPATPVVPTTPATPAMPAVPGAPALEVDPKIEQRNELNKTINRINDYHGVNREMVTAELLKPFGADTVGAIEDLEGCLKSAEAWVKQLDEIEKYLNLFDDIAKAHGEHAESITNGIDQLSQSHGAKDYTGLTVTKGLDFLNALFNWYKQWAEAFNIPLTK